MKTPVLRPATEAVLFGFERIGMVIRIAWLPIVIAIALYVVPFVLFMGGSIHETVQYSSGDPEAAIEALFESPGFIGFYILQSTILPLLASLVLSCVYVAATRASTLAEYEPPSLPFYFALGPRELKYWVTKILYAILIVLVTVVIASVGAGVAAGAVAGAEAMDGEAKALVIAPAVAIGIWLVLIWLWILLRFLPVLPIAAVENRIAFGDAWKMTKGNFWRLLLSGAMFLALLQGVTLILFVAIILPPAIILGLLAVFGAGFIGPAALILLVLLGLIVFAGMIALAAFALAAESAYPARIYAYLSGCGDACKI